MKAGINLFSIRNLIKTEEDFLDTAIKLRDMGYSSMQYSGGEYDPGRIRRVSRASGLPICLTHVPYDRIVNETDALMEEHESFGCKSIGLGAMNSQYVLDESKFKSCVESLNIAGEKMKQNGFRFCYHHHSFEFYKMGDETCFDYILKNAPFVDFTVDTYWLQYGGVDILNTIEQIGDRMAYLHLKDYKIDKQLKDDGKSYRFVPDFSPVGDGNIDFKAIIARTKNMNVSEYIVEQDNAALFSDSLEQVRRSINYITKNL